jgi:hypothetical protein
MAKVSKKKIGGVIGGIGLLAVTAAVCVKGLKVLDGRMKQKEEILPDAPAAEPLEDFLEE